MASDAKLYCRFGKRDLEHRSWLAPLVNNRLGDLLNVELRHEQLFFIRGKRVLEDVGYSVRGRRYREAEAGRPIHSLADLARHGYRLVGRSYDPEVMREALRRQQDGYYFSLFSNQCQDWADRLRHLAERIERERGAAAPVAAPPARELPVLPVEPASIGMGLVALLLGAGAVAAPIVSGQLFAVILGLLVLVSGVSHVAYGLHARDWRNLLAILGTAAGHLATGVLVLLNRRFAALAGSLVIAAALGLQGAWSVVVALFGRPRAHWLGTLVSGAIMLAGAVLAAIHWHASGARVLGLVVGLSLLAGGWSTIWLSWRTRRVEA